MAVVDDLRRRMNVLIQMQNILRVQRDRLARENVDRGLVVADAAGFAELFPVGRTVFGIVPMLFMRCVFGGHSACRKQPGDRQ